MPLTFLSLTRKAENFMKRGDQIAGIIFLLFSAFVMEEAWRMPKQAIAGRTSFGPGVGFLPFWIGLIMACFSIILIVSASLKPADPTQKAIFPRGKHLKSVILLPVSLGAYIYLLDVIGYLVGTFLFAALPDTRGHERHMETDPSGICARISLALCHLPGTFRGRAPKEYVWILETPSLVKSFTNTIERV